MAWLDADYPAGDAIVLLIIFLALILLYIQTLLPAFYLVAQVGVPAQMGAPDTLPEPTAKLLRSRNAARNMLETLPIFLTLAVLTLVLKVPGNVPVIGGVMYLVARIGHVVSHVNALSPWRSLSYFVSVAGLVVIAVPLVPYIWA
ncbi:MAPEG family protein [Devosia sp.]|uniref:MAPEG family protein n=1 Tax=Devosia sp. TaxID=1871048 RepID=UPI003264DEB1